MKKTLTLGLLVSAVSIAQAASLNWMINNVTLPETTTPASGVSIYLFISEQSKGFGAGATSINAVSDFITTGAEFYTDTEGKNYLKKGDDKIGIAAMGTANTSGGISGATGFNANNFAGGDSLKAFAVIFDSNSLATAKNFIVTSEKSASWTSGTGAKMLGFGSQANATWTPVPEPSTAVLALAGLALLLKRRRA